MIDREKVIKALEFCTDQRIVDTCYGGCPYAVADDDYKCLQMKLDALALLKEQEAVEPIPYHRSDGTIFKYECRKCRTKIFKGDLFCRHCSNPVLWKGR